MQKQDINCKELVTKLVELHELKREFDVAMDESEKDMKSSSILNVRRLYFDISDRVSYLERESRCVLAIDRSKPLDLSNLFSPGNLNSLLIIDEQDEKSLVLDRIYIDDIKLESPIALNSRENYVSEQTRVEALKKKSCIMLDAKVLETFILNPELIPEGWQNPHIYIHFTGTTFYDRRNDNYCNLRLGWFESKWKVDVSLFSAGRGVLEPAAIIELKK